MSSSRNRFLYIFLDEAGDFDFSVNGSRYFLLGSVSRERPFGDYNDFINLKYELVEHGMNIEYYHASEDTQSVRDKVFEIIAHSLAGMRIDSLIVEKRKTNPELHEATKFYSRMLGSLLRYILERYALSQYSEVLVFTDRIPVSGKRSAVEKAVKTTLSRMLPKSGRYRLLHHDSKSNFQLQIADYCNWAIFRKWSRSDLRSYNLIKPAIRSEFDIFRNGTIFYY